MLKKCVMLPPGEERKPVWNFSTWLQMPRGRLLMPLGCRLVSSVILVDVSFACCFDVQGSG